MFLSGYPTKGKTENSVKAGRLCHHLPKGGGCYGICVHNDIYYHFNCVNHNHKKITPALAKH